ncbi:MAG: primosomal protein N' [Planctomycetota bacterium]
MYARIALDLPVPTEFTYSVPPEMRPSLQPGQRVRVPFRHTTRVGYCVALETSTDIAKTKDITSVVDKEPLVPPDLLELGKWISEYYACSLGEALQAMLPGGVRRGQPKVRRVVRVGDQPAPARAKKAALVLAALERFETPPTVGALLAAASSSRAALSTLERAGLARVDAMEADEVFETPPPRERDEPPVLTDAQETALAAMEPDLLQPSYGAHLLLGVTGSGKTEVYLRAIASTLRCKRQAIVLVPEIALTPQTVRRFRARFDRVAVLHSAQSESSRRKEWRRIRQGEADVVVGPRSAVFAPVERLGLIVVDEEHENSFKQDNAPRYNARDVALVRAKAASCPVILGSATPSLESFANARRGRYGLHRLPERVGGREMPPVELIDMGLEKARLFSRQLRLAVSQAIRDGGQVILFLNRRGFATVVVCPRCKHTFECPHCSTTLVFHKGRRRTACHLCGHQARLPDACPECHHAEFDMVGSGTERVTEEAEQAWPGISMARVDSDTVRGAELERVLEEFRAGTTRILIGTQMVAKGHHFPKVTLVGVINADTALHLPDFRANERTFALISQVAGRAGRGDDGGRVLVQTYNPDHYAIRAAAEHDYLKFAEAELEERELVGMPPSRRAAVVSLSAEDDRGAERAGRELAAALRAAAERAAEVGHKVEIRGPARAPIERIRGRWRWMILLLSDSATALASVARTVKATRFPKKIDVTLDVDPIAVL